jgi:hypothetical protein
MTSSTFGIVDKPVLPESISKLFNAEQLIGQFILSYAVNRTPEGWPSCRTGDWFLGKHPSLPVIRLAVDGGRLLGWLLGYPISSKGELLSDHAELLVPAYIEDSTEAIEHFIYSFGGRFAAVFLETNRPRFYLDACGSLSAVYCASQQIVASTPNLIPYDQQTLDRVDLISAMGIPYIRSKYPVGLTPRYSVERILPNHYLDLSNWQQKRHWPLSPLTKITPIDEGLTEIATIVKRNISAVVSKYPTQLHLTAGQDSRMLLACSKNLAKKLELITARIPDDTAIIDCDIAHKIADKFQLSHSTLLYKEAKTDDLNEWLFRIGCAAGEPRGWQSATTFKQLENGHAKLYGVLGELARGPLWLSSDSATSRVTPERLIETCMAPVTDSTLSRVRNWLKQVPASDTFNLLDLFYIEQHKGCHSGIWPYSECDAGFAIFPLCHRGVIERMLTLPINYRRSGSLMKDIIAREWRQLLELPINRPVGSLRFLMAAEKKMKVIRKNRARIVKAMKDPAWAISRSIDRVHQFLGSR